MCNAPFVLSSCLCYFNRLLILWRMYHDVMRLIVVGGYSRFSPCINLLLMVVTVLWSPASSGIVQSVSLRWEGCPRSATVMILLLMTIRWRLVYVCTQYICKVIFTHWYLLKSVLSQGQINYLYWCLVWARRALGRSGCGGDGLAVCWPGRRGCNILAAFDAPAAVGPSRGRSVRSCVHARLPGYKFLLVNAFKLPVLATTWQASFFIFFVILFYFLFFIFFLYFFSKPFSSFHPYHNQGSELIWKNAAPPGRSMTAALCLNGFSINTNCTRHSWFTGTLMRYYPCFV